MATLNQNLREINFATVPTVKNHGHIDPNSDFFKTKEEAEKKCRWNQKVVPVVYISNTKTMDSKAYINEQYMSKGFFYDEKREALCFKVEKRVLKQGYTFEDVEKYADELFRKNISFNMDSLNKFYDILD